MEILKSMFLLISCSVPTILIEWANLFRTKSMNVKFLSIRSSRPEVSSKKVFLNVFAEFIEKYL